MAGGVSIFVSLGIWLCFRFSPSSLYLLYEAQVHFWRSSLSFSIYVDMYAIFYYYTRQIDVTILWVTRYVVV